MASVINNIFKIQEFYIAGIKKDANDAHKRDVLKAVF